MVSRVSVIGLGKLGSPMCACLASKGLDVIGVDVDPEKVRAINDARPPVNETGLDELMLDAAPHLRATTDIEEAVRKTDVTFVVVATPSEPSGRFSLDYILPACQKIGEALRSKDKFHVVSITSTVMPQDTDGPIRMALELASGKKCGEQFGLCYNPEFIALGSVIHDFLNPDFVLLGASDPLSECWISGIYKKVCDNDPPIASVSIINAEIAKLSLNSYVTMKISFANQLARICEEIHGADVDAVTFVIGQDSRIGKKYLKGALSYGGPCFPRDNRALATLIPYGWPDLPSTVDKFNRRHIGWLVSDILDRFDGPFTVLGTSYKVESDVKEEAAGFLLLEELKKRGALIAATYLGNTVIVALPDPKFKEYDYSGTTVVDCWRFLPELKENPTVNYVPLGIGPCVG